MRNSYIIALVFGFLALLLSWGICLHGPVDDHTEVHVGVSDD